MKHTRLSVAAFAAVLAGAIFAVLPILSDEPTPAATSPCIGASPGVIRHVVWIFMENHDYAQIAGHSPYLNTLGGQCAVGTQANLTHPSLPNYMAATGGATIFTNDCTTCTTGGPSIFGQVGAAGWKAYEESMPSAGYLGATSGRYAKKHNPASYYTAIRSAYATRGVPMGSYTAGALHSDVVNGRLPRFSFVTPNLCSDEHDCAVSTGDAWLSKVVPMILAGPNYQAGDTLLVIPYDESAHRLYDVHRLCCAIRQGWHTGERLQPLRPASPSRVEAGAPPARQGGDRSRPAGGASPVSDQRWSERRVFLCGFTVGFLVHHGCRVVRWIEWRGSPDEDESAGTGQGRVPGTPPGTRG
jgi:hypothetical protein